MLALFRPDMTVGCVTDLSAEGLSARGIRGLLLDIDNTLVPWNEKIIPETIRSWAAELSQRGFIFCLVSNSTASRTASIAGQLKCPYVHQAMKPGRRGFAAALRLLDLPQSAVAVVGDQLLTDVFGGNKSGLCTIWVQPLSPNEFVGTRVNRLLEKVVIHLLKKKDWPP